MNLLPAIAVVATVFAAGPAPAQRTVQTPNGYSNTLGSDSALLRAQSDTFHRTLETPTMRRQKLARAIALRDEVAVLQAQDGGTLSEKNRAYVRRKSQAILNYQR